MIVVAVVVVLVLLVGVGVVVAATGAASSSDGDGDGTGWSAAAIVPVVGAVLVVLLAVTVLGVGGSVVDLGGSGEEPVEGRVDEVPIERAPEDDDDADDEPVALAGSPATYEGRVAIERGASALRPPPVVDELAAGDVVEVRATGFVEHAEGLVAQCPRADSAVCRNVVPIVTDGAGRVRVPYRVETAPSGEVLVVEVDLDRGTAQLAFGAAPSRPELSVRGRAAVAIRDAVPGDRLALRRCEPDADALDECETVGRPIVVAAEGTASAPIQGMAGGASLLVLTGPDGRVLAEPVRMVLAPRSSATKVDLSSMQLLVGFGVTLLLLGVAVALIRTTDWRVPAEAATPFLDAAPLEG